MAEFQNKQFLDYEGVEIIKQYIDKGDTASATAASTAEANAKAYTDALANGAVKTNTDNLAAEITRAKAAEEANANAAAAALAKAEEKVASVGAGDASITVGGTATAPTVAVKLSQTAGNTLTVDETGLYVNVPTASEYTIVKDETSSDYAAVYHLTKDGVNVGAAINIPKDMVLQSGRVEGDKLILVLNDANNTEIEVNVGSLIEYVTSGSQAGDMVVVAIDETTHKVTATITDGTVTKAKLEAGVQTSLNKADSALQEDSIATGETNGTIKVGSKEVAVKGLGSAAYTDTTAYDATGSAQAVYDAITAIPTSEISALFA